MVCDCTDGDAEIFKLHLNNCHCRHILFGCSHDNGYARLLEDVADTPVTDRITLLEGVPFERELNLLKSKYETTKFGGIFRTTKINAYQQQHHQQQQQQYLTLSQPTPPESRTPSAPSTSGPSINFTSQAGTSWATTAISSTARLASPPPTPQPLATASITIPRNRYGQRIDPLLKYDHNDVKRVKELHMCNVHFLRGDCPYAEGCSHVHNYKPNKNELQTLKYIARLTPCRFGSECDEIKCIYGHRYVLCTLSYERITTK